MNARAARGSGRQASRLVSGVRRAGDLLLALGHELDEPVPERVQVLLSALVSQTARNAALIEETPWMHGRGLCLQTELE